MSSTNDTSPLAIAFGAVEEIRSYQVILTVTLAGSTAETPAQALALVTNRVHEALRGIGGVVAAPSPQLPGRKRRRKTQPPVSPEEPAPRSYSTEETLAAAKEVFPDEDEQSTAEPLTSEQAKILASVFPAKGPEA